MLRRPYLIRLMLNDYTSDDATADAGPLSPQPLEETHRRAIVLSAIKFDLANAEVARLSGFPDVDSYREWKVGLDVADGHPPPQHVLLLLAMFERLERGFKTVDRSRAWLNRANTLFGGLSPLEFMLAGGINAIGAVAIHLDPKSAGLRP